MAKSNFHQLWDAAVLTSWLSISSGFSLRDDQGYRLEGDRVNMRYHKLLEPVQIGQMELRNRIVMPGMGTNLCTEDGYVTERYRAYYEERARGGVGLIIVGICGVDFPVGKVQFAHASLDDDRFIPGNARLVQAIKKHGAKVAAQLVHAGGGARELITKTQPVGPSAVPVPPSPKPRELTAEEIAQIVLRFGQAARRAKEAGFDAIEIHAAHRYLLANFISAATNTRQDAYGGSLENRARILLETIEAVRQSVGKNYPVWCRINGAEFGIEHGITLEEALPVARMAQEAGVDAIHVSAQGYGLLVDRGPVTQFPGNLVPLAEEVKKAVSIPVIAVGRISLDLGEKLLRQRGADLIAMGRPLIADPDLPNKVKSGCLSDIRPCIYCNWCSAHSAPTEYTRPLDCSVNAAAGIENEYRVEPAERVKRILVVGGGPGGMEVARVASQRGHSVVLCEKEARLGGSLNISGIFKSEFENLANYLNRQVRKAGIKVLVEKEFTPNLIEDIRPDVAVLAVGPALPLPDIPGVDRDNVINGTQVRQMMRGHFRPGRHTRGMNGQKVICPLAGLFLRRFFKPSLTRRLTRLWMPLGRRVIIIGGDRVGCDTAEFLAERGRKVTIMESDEGGIGAGLTYHVRTPFIHRLAARGVTMLAGVKYEEITEKGVVITTGKGERQSIEADTIILAMGAKSNTELSGALRGVVPEVYRVGDCAEPRGILETIAEASRIARAI